MRLLLLPVPLFLLLGSCIDGEEHTWLEQDGSGRLEARYKMPVLVMNNFGGAEELAHTLQEAADRDPHVALSRIDHRLERGSVIFEFAGTFDDLRMLCTFPQRQLRDPERPDEPVQAEALFGETDLRINPLGISFHRTVDLSPVLPENIKRAPGILGDSSFRYHLHLPVDARETNAHGRSDEGTTLTWSFVLKDHVSKPMILTARAPLPIPSWVWWTVATTLLGGALLVRRTLRRGPRRATPRLP